MTTFTVTALSDLSTSEVKKLKQLFKKNFPDNWGNSTPFPSDDVIMQFDGLKLIGMTMLHCEPPYKFKEGSGYYMYNLCVEPKLHGKGHGTKLMEFAKEKYHIIHVHDDPNGPNNDWFSNRGFTKGGRWNKYIELSWKFGHKKIDREPDKWSPQYDPLENIFYMD
jgi:ribosomal protein S18 acetylase RimI-like enzyme